MTGGSDLLLPRYLTTAGKYQTRHWKLHCHSAENRAVFWVLNPDNLLAEEVRITNMTGASKIQLKMI